jgi:site-specific DNA recombinase
MSAEPAPDAPAEADLANAVSYLRVSTAQQADRDGDPEGYSIPAQRDANRRKATSLGAAVVAEFVDAGESARSADRPELQKLLVYVREHPVAYVIVHKVDRLARNRIDDIEINLALRQAGVTLVSATENIDETPSGMLLHGIMSSIAEFYSRNLANEVTKGMTQKAKTGGTPGKAPLGYRNVRLISAEGREVRTVKVDPDRAPLITWAYETYATGRWTLNRLVDELDARGLTTLPTTKQPARPIRLNHLHKILTHPYYQGEVVWGGARYQGRHTPLIDPATWQTVQTVLASHRVGEKEREHPHYLKSSVFCGSCGSRLIVTNSKNRYGVVYPYFVCLGRHQKRTGCTRKAMLITQVEELVEDYYIQVQLAPELRQELERVLGEELAESRTQAEAAERDLTIQRQRLVNERAKLLQAHYAGAVPLDLLKSEQDRIAGQLSTIEDRLRSIAVRFETLETNLRDALDLASDCYRAYLQAPDHVRRLFNQALFEQLYLDEDGVHAELAEPFRTLLAPDLLPTLIGQTAQEEVPAGDGGKDLAAVESRWAADRYRRVSSVQAGAARNNKPAPEAYRGAGLKETTLVPPAGFEPAPLPPEGSALSPELRGLGTTEGTSGPVHYPSVA